MTAAAHQTDSVTAAALARMHDYMRRARPAATDEQALIARDAYVQGFYAGGRWALHASAYLATPEFREAIDVLARLWADEPNGWAT